MQHVIQPGESLWRIAGALFGDARKWPEIAHDNRLHHPHRLHVGQVLQVRDSLVKANAPAPDELGPRANDGSMEHATPVIPASAHIFVLADEINPLRQKAVRKVMVSPTMALKVSLKLGRRVPVMPNPEVFGIHPTAPQSSPVSIGRHAIGLKPSPFSSASSSLLGSARIDGSRFWIDVEKAKKAGATFHDSEEILSDLDRIAKKTKRPADLANIERIKGLVKADAEVLIRGPLPNSAIKGGASMGFTRGLQGVQIVGFAITAIDLTQMTQRSIEQGSLKPITAETVRQVGGWAAAWAGAKLGGAGGALLGIETGPGALVTGAIGGLIGGFAGYYGADWIADHVSEN